jgi:hypothetical protein
MYFIFPVLILIFRYYFSALIKKNEKGSEENIENIIQSSVWLGNRELCQLQFAV